MAGFIGGRTSAFDYIGPDLPNNPQNGEMWFDTDGASDGSGEVKVYDGADDAWQATGFTSHADLTDVTRSAHHPPVEVSGPLTQPSDQSLGLSIGSGLGVDSNDQIHVPGSAVSASMLAFDPATQNEFDTHAGDTNAHHSRYTDQEARDAAGVPSGVITMWSGSSTNVPSGWTLCDGSDGTPDLRDRFIVGTGGSYTSGDTGGAESVSLSEAEMPSHDHNVPAKEYDDTSGDLSSAKTDTSGSSYDIGTSSAGGDQAHENRPPFYALAFIMKT